MRSPRRTGSPTSPCPVAEPFVVLASASPRRLELLRRIGIEPEVRPADVDETTRSGERPDALVARLAEAKALAVGEVPDGVLVVAADTVVVLGAQVLGKPTDPAEATDMLTALSGIGHRVLTGVHVRCGNRSAGAVEATRVRFRPLGAAEIEAYVATGEPLDKAGGYGIQGIGGMFVDSIEGSDTNVVGLPLAALVRLASDVGVELLPRRL
jgi:septum formation protein